MVKNLPAIQEIQVQCLGGEEPWRREWLPTPVFSPREFHRQRSLGGYSAWGCKESDMTEQLALSLFRGEDGEGREIDEGGQEVHIFSYKANKLWGCQV